MLSRKVLRLDAQHCGERPSFQLVRRFDGSIDKGDEALVGV
jgi:hypothetical protein